RCGGSRGRRPGLRGARMAGLAWKWPRTRLPVGASALGVFVLCWLYVFPVYRLPDEKEIVQGVLLQQGKAWRRNHTAVAGFSCGFSSVSCSVGAVLNTINFKSICFRN
uniref:Alpha-N-acetylneuraminide alpha-2,8-sialyltransferase n=1 Tax=Anser brachyrhynchus TaxID=132585 RepID=A0A8B9IC95_9AVES